MKFEAKVSRFDQKEGIGRIHCSAMGSDVMVHSADVLGGAKLYAGDLVTFEISFVGCLPQARNIHLVAKLSRTQPAARLAVLEARTLPAVEPAWAAAERIQSCSPQPASAVEVKLKEPLMTELRSQPTRRRDDKEQCNGCQKWMIPRLWMEKGAGSHSVCPFCGELHKDFRQPETPNLRTVVGGVLLAGLASALFGS